MPSFIKRFAALCVLLSLGACVTPIPPSPQELAAKRFETVPGKAVVYVFRDLVNFGGTQSPIALDGKQIGASYGGTFFHLVVDPGPHRLAGMFGDAGSMQFTVAAGELYFIQQTVQVSFGLVTSFFGTVGAAEGRSRVSQYQLTNY
ncbi:MAG: DUF2846 domain-containing protein [Burkholderiales bacterium]